MIMIYINFCSQKEFRLALNDFYFLRNFEKPNMVVLVIRWVGRSYFRMLVKWGVIIKRYGGEKFQKLQSDPPTIKHKRVVL